MKRTEKDGLVSYDNSELIEKLTQMKCNIREDNPYRTHLKNFIKAQWYNNIKHIENPGNDSIFKELTFNIIEIMNSLGLSENEFSLYYTMIYNVYHNLPNQNLNMYGLRELFLKNKDIDNIFLCITDTIVNK